MTTDYNQLADTFGDIRGASFKRYSEEWTFFKVLGPVQGQSVLDVACGDGYYTRALRQQGADPVVGVDIAEKMIEHARQNEAQAPLGITYYVHDVANLEPLGAFDVVTGVYLLVYAATESTLQGMCQSVRNNLAADGRFVTVLMNPDISAAQFPIYERYGMRMAAEGPLRDGTPITITIATPDGPFQITNYHWSKATYERIFHTVGFRSIVWHPMMVSPEGIQSYGAEYWQSFLDAPNLVVCECRP